MTFSILVEASDGRFEASLAGVPGLCVVEPTRSEAITALKAEIEQRIARGELVTLEIEAGSVSSLAGKYRTDSTLRDICDTAYQRRDAEHES